MEPHLAEDEELQKLKTWWKKNGTSIITGVVLGIAAIGGLNGWRVYEQNRAETASALFGQLQDAFVAEEADKIEQLSKELADDFSATPYAANGAMLYAAYAHAGNDSSTAISQLRWVLDESDNESLKHTARLRLGALHLAEGDHQAALKLLEVEDNSGFESFYAELKADAYTAAGQSAKAREHYDEALQGVDENADYAAVIRAKRNAVAE